jgi:hypothetical protein
MRRIMVAMAAALLTAVTAQAGPEITREEFQAAVSAKGFNRKCLRLSDQMRGLFNALAAANGQRYTTNGTGFSVEVCSPANWIARRMDEAKRKYMDLKWEDLNEQDRANVFHVIALPDRTTNLNVENTVGVEHVVLRHPGKKERESIIQQPIFKREFGVEENNSLGGEKTVAGVDAAFPIEAVNAVRDNNGEFLVTVVGESGEKNFKVKTKHLDDLGMTRVASY